MLMKLALRNVRRSVRDYAVYFVTLTLGVAVFYAFNAIGDSRVLFEAQEGAAKGITANAICPGYIGTEMVRAIPEKVLNEKIIPQIPAGRLGERIDAARQDADDRE